MAIWRAAWDGAPLCFLNQEPRLIFAIGIPFVGERTGQLLATHFGSMEKLAAAGAEELTEVHEIGPKIAQGVSEFFLERVNQEFVKRLRAAGVNMKEERTAPVDTKFAGMTFVLTGTLTKRSREEAEALVVCHDGESGFPSAKN